MKNRSGYLISIYIVLSILHITFIILDSKFGIYATKPLLMATLGWWFYLMTKNKFTIPSKLFLIGMFSSLFGDTFLMFHGEEFFLLGLASFLVAHIFYIFSFFKYPRFSNGIIIQKPLKSMPFLLYLLVVAGFLWENLGEMKLPVLFYSFVITIMAISAMNMKNRIDFRSFLLILSGAILFVISDTVIAINKFKSTGLPEILNRLIIMTSYLIGQYLLAKGNANSAGIKLNSPPIVGSPK